MRTRRFSTAMGFGLALAACNGEVSGVTPLDGPHGAHDFARPGDGSFPPGTDLTPMLNICGDFDPGCTQSTFGPPQVPFPLQSDPGPKPGEADSGVDRDMNG